MTLRRQNARYLSLYGNEAIDMKAAFNVLYVEGAHMAGSSVKKGIKLKRTAPGLEDIVPALCYLTGFLIPNQAEGAILYQTLENLNR